MTVNAASPAGASDPGIALVSEPTRILLVSGSTRAASTNTAALRALAAPPVTAVLYDEMADLPAFNPDDDHDRLPPAPARLRQQIAAADAIVFCTPEYAGALPGSFKNLLDWTVGGGEIYRKPVAWINVAAEGRGDAAQQSLASVLGYVGGEPIRAACRRITVARGAVGADGLVADAQFRTAAAEVLRAVLDHVSARRADPERPRPATAGRGARSFW
jgi:chromate reductase, NAD(P)H dehydrogenase (quinone)